MWRWYVAGAAVVALGWHSESKCMYCDCEQGEVRLGLKTAHQLPKGLAKAN